MSSITRPAVTMADALRMLSSNFQSVTNIQGSLELLIDLNASLQFLRQYNIKMLATRKRPNTEAIEELIFCKRTTPIVSAPKPKSLTATKEGPARRHQSISTQTTRDEQQKRIARDFQRRKAVEAARMKDSEEKRRQQLMVIEEYKQQRLQAVRFGGSDFKENQKPKGKRGNCFKCRF
ncbi:Protein CBG11028 [Caenorhabditis briggsae]|uniref:Protein CBG11028 n=1 Tax=Caenorhabditis briggsae TaxID=6238 RepID=A8XC25_CAEBR|nr:Protein CBG11028 [Caenorhabditis briggsae]CAP30264.2 Protein CBG11028 [Caenorhabditis briggsae]